MEEWDDWRPPPGAPLCFKCRTYLPLARSEGEKEDRVRGGEETLISEISQVIVDPPRGTGTTENKEDKTGSDCEPSNMFSDIWVSLFETRHRRNGEGGNQGWRELATF